MYNGVNDENNESGFNSDENLYHYSYSKDQAPQPGQPDPSQTSWQPAPRPEPQAVNALVGAGYPPLTAMVLAGRGHRRLSG